MSQPRKFVRVRGKNLDVKINPTLVTGKYFCVTPYAGTLASPRLDDARFAVTHIPSGYALVPLIENLNTARLIALQIEQFKLPWQSKEVAVIIKAFKRLGPKNRALILELQAGKLPKKVSA
jgi:hypothetical protein